MLCLNAKPCHVRLKTPGFAAFAYIKCRAKTCVLMESSGAQLETTKTEFAEFLFLRGRREKGLLNFLIFGIFVSERTLILPSKVSQISFKTCSNFPRSSHTYLRKNFQQLDILLQTISTIEILEATLLTNFVCSLL